MFSNPNIRKYTIFNPDDTIKEQYEREPHPDDIPATYNSKKELVPPVFNGAWVKVPDSKVAELNELIKAKNKNIYKVLNPNKKKKLQTIEDREKSEAAKRDLLEKQLEMLEAELARRLENEKGGE